MQAQAKAVADGKSAVPGVNYDASSRRWFLQTLLQWGVKRRHLMYASSREEAEILAATYHPRLKAAADEDRFDDEFDALKAELAAEKAAVRDQVQCSI